MNIYLKSTAVSLLAILLVGCECPMRKATAHRTVDVGAASGPRGFVEFSAQTNRAIVPIYRINDDGSARLLSGVGLKEGRRYNLNRTPVVVAERLTVAAPAGPQQFRIDGSGPQVKVNVTEGKTTPVVVNYKLIDSGDIFVIYRADARVLQPTEAKQ